MLRGRERAISFCDEIWTDRRVHNRPTRGIECIERTIKIELFCRWRVREDRFLRDERRMDIGHICIDKDLTTISCTIFQCDDRKWMTRSIHNIFTDRDIVANYEYASFRIKVTLSNVFRSVQETIICISWYAVPSEF